MSSKSEWCSVLVFVKKSDSGRKMILDYRRLNDQMVLESNFFLDLWKMLRSLVGFKVYICLDINLSF